MATRQPFELPEWASDGTLITEPSSGQKATGFTPGQTPSSEVQNWWQELSYRWIEHVQNVRVDMEARALSNLRLVYDTGSSDELHDIAIATNGTAKDKIIVVGNAAKIALLNKTVAGTSETPDGAISTDFYAVTWDATNQRFILAGENDEIQTSTGNTTWTQSSTTGSPLNAVATSPAGVTVAAGDSASIKQSTNATSYTVRTSPVVGANWKGAVFDPVNNRFFILADTGSMGLSSDATGVSWTEFRTAVGAADVVNLGYHANWGTVARYNNTLEIVGAGFTGAEYTIVELTDAFTGMLLLDSSIIFYDPGNAGTSVLQVWGANLENRRTIHYIAGNIPVTKFAVLNGQIWALTNDIVYNGGLV